MSTLRSKRIVAMGIDGLLLLLLWAVVYQVVDNSIASNRDEEISMFIALPIFWFINSLLEGFAGQTIGKMIMRLKIISSRFYKVNLFIAMTRNLLKILLLPISAIVYLVSNNESVTLHDKIAGTEMIQL